MMVTAVMTITLTTQLLIRGHNFLSLVTQKWDDKVPVQY